MFSIKLCKLTFSICPDCHEHGITNRKFIVFHKKQQNFSNKSFQNKRFQNEQPQNEYLLNEHLQNENLKKFKTRNFKTDTY